MAKKGVSTSKIFKIFRLGMLFIFILLPMLVLSQDYHQLLVTKDGKNALVNIKRLPITESLISFEVSVNWVTNDLTVIKDTISQIVFNPGDVIISSNNSLKINGEDRYLCFNESVKLSIEYDNDEFPGGDLKLNIPLYYLKEKSSIISKSDLEEFFFKNPDLLVYITNITEKDVEFKPNLIVEYRVFEASDGSNSLISGQGGNLTYYIKNEGNDRSAKLQILISEELNNPDIIFNDNYQIMALEPNQDTIFKIPVSASYALKDGNAGFKLSFLDSVDYVGQPVTCYVQTKAILDNQAPLITINMPMELGFKISSSSEKQLIQGIVKDNVAVQKLAINGVDVSFDESGYFSYLLEITPNSSEVNVRASDYSYNITSKVLAIESSISQLDTAIINWGYPTDFYSNSKKKYVVLKSCVGYSGQLSSVNIYNNDQLVKEINSFEQGFTDDCIYFVEQELTLNEGRNNIVFELNIDGESIKSERIINYSPFGNYYALLIGIEDYDYLNDLKEPVKDAIALKKVLVDNYSFEEENVFVLKNTTRNEILDMLDNLVQQVGEDDNLLIFYAGHGYWDKTLGKEGEGFWLPKDAKIDKRSNWISNSNLTNYIGGIKSKHTLLLSDACFSGGIFRSISNISENKSINKLYDLPSRKAMTSGTLSEVPDHSVFMEYLIKRLKENTSKYLSSRSIYSSLEEAVRNNSDNVPQFGTIQKTGDEGGDFIFIKKE
ncbi:MAG: caspase family protein [Bacteroidales bacterium]|nr:caspase family protein [Bacteroidales bacterium]